jgi:hypothetical protein
MSAILTKIKQKKSSQAQETFELAMKALFQVPKTQVQRKIQKTKRKD